MWWQSIFNTCHWFFADCRRSSPFCIVCRYPVFCLHAVAVYLYWLPPICAFAQYDRCGCQPGCHALTSLDPLRLDYCSQIVAWCSFCGLFLLLLSLDAPYYFFCVSCPRTMHLFVTLPLRLTTRYFCQCPHARFVPGGYDGFLRFLPAAPPRTWNVRGMFQFDNMLNRANILITYYRFPSHFWTAIFLRCLETKCAFIEFCSFNR